MTGWIVTILYLVATITCGEFARWGAILAGHNPSAGYPFPDFEGIVRFIAGAALGPVIGGIMGSLAGRATQVGKRKPGGFFLGGAVLIGPAFCLLVCHQLEYRDQMEKRARIRAEFIHRKQETARVRKILEPFVHQKEEWWGLSSDGTPRRIFLNSEDGRKGSHAIEFRFVTKRFQLPEDKRYGHPYDWSFEASIPGGGFVRNENDPKLDSYDPVEAPAEGYQEKIRYDFPATLPEGQWKTSVKDSYFVKFPDGTYGRIRLNVEGFTDRRPLRMETCWNPKPGSRNISSLSK